MSKILVCTKKYTIDDAQSTLTQIQGDEERQDVLDKIAVGYFLDLDYLNYYVSDSSMLENCEVIYEVDMDHRIYYDNENEVYYYISTDRNDMPMRESMKRIFERGYFDKYRDPNAKIKTSEDFCREHNIDEIKECNVRKLIRETIERHLNEDTDESVIGGLKNVYNNRKNSFNILKQNGFKDFKDNISDDYQDGYNIEGFKKCVNLYKKMIYAYKNGNKIKYQFCKENLDDMINKYGFDYYDIKTSAEY